MKESLKEKARWFTLNSEKDITFIIHIPFFVSLPTGNPGAYRLFANLLSLPKASK
ncbi:MAG: hypothetical protein WKF71_15495 [Pyrinomonadaceae bacterium]